MENLTLGQYLSNSHPLNTKSQRTDEVIVTILAASVLAYMCKPLLDSAFFKGVGDGIGGFFGGIGSLFKGAGERIRSKRDKNRDEESSSRKKSKKSKETTNADYDDDINSMMMNMLDSADSLNKNEKDEAVKKSNQHMSDLIRASIIDSDGNPLPTDKWQERFKNISGKTPEEWTKEHNIEMPGDDEIKKIESHLKKDIENKTESERDEIAEKGNELGKKTAKELSDSRDGAYDELDKVMKDLENEKNEDKKKELEKKKRDLEKKIETIEKQQDDNSKKELEKNEPEKDEDGNIVKDEEITDPETGEKKKVKTHTGPRGGKFYYPEGKPHHPENRVYVKESLSSWLSIRL